MKAAVAVLLLLGCLPSLQAQTHQSRLTTAEFRRLSGECAPDASPATLMAVARTESALQIYAISVNDPHTLARLSGYPGASVELARQPRTMREALAWLRWFRQHRITVSIGLMQVNVSEARRYGVRAKALLDPCENIAAGARILADDYAAAKQHFRSKREAINAALSAYNSGSWIDGIQNGYVSRIYRNY